MDNTLIYDTKSYYGLCFSSSRNCGMKKNISHKCNGILNVPKVQGIYILNYTNIYHNTKYSIVVYVNITNSFENYKLLFRYSSKSE